jgi:hypothetical protein
LEEGEQTVSLKSLAACSTLAAAIAVPVLAGEEIKPRDLTPVTRMKVPAHPPIEIVREERARWPGSHRRTSPTISVPKDGSTWQS